MKALQAAAALVVLECPQRLARDRHIVIGCCVEQRGLGSHRLVPEEHLGCGLADPPVRMLEGGDLERLKARLLEAPFHRPDRFGVKRMRRIARDGLDEVHFGSRHREQRMALEDEIAVLPIPAEIRVVACRALVAKRLPCGSPHEVGQAPIAEHVGEAGMSSRIRQTLERPNALGPLVVVLAGEPGEERVEVVAVLGLANRLVVQHDRGRFASATRRRQVAVRGLRLAARAHPSRDASIWRRYSDRAPCHPHRTQRDLPSSPGSNRWTHAL